MREITIDELKKIQMDILVKVADFCEANNLKYSLAYGTLLGAVRHKGYIPWDDDIDIMMPRKDYDRFIYSFNGSIPNLAVDAPELHLDYYAPYANVYDKRTLLVEEYLSHGKREVGVKIDIFPLDNVPEDDILCQSIYSESKKYNRICGIKNARLGFYHGTPKVKLVIKKMLYSIFSFKHIQKKHIEILLKSNELSSGLLVDIIVFPTYGIKRIESKYIFPMTDLEFERHTFKVPGDYDKYLSYFYGDYMQLPPIEKRVAHHHFKAYWK